MSRKYLKNGQEVEIIRTISEDEYLIDYIVEIEDNYSGAISTGNLYMLTIVKKSEVFDKAPTHLIDQEMLDKIEIKRILEKEIRTIDQAKRDLAKEVKDLEAKRNRMKDFMFDFSGYKTAERLAFFPEKGLFPIVVGKEDFKNSWDHSDGVNIRIEILSTKKEHLSYMFVDYEGRGGRIYNKIDQEYGIMLNPTDEQIVAASHERIHKMDLTKLTLYDFEPGKGRLTPSKYIPESLLTLYREKKAEEEAGRIVALQHEINQKQKDLESLKANLSESPTII